MWSRNINVFAQLEGNISPSPMVEFDTRLDKSYRQPRLPHSNTKYAKQPQPHWERGPDAMLPSCYWQLSMIETSEQKLHQRQQVAILSLNASLGSLCATSSWRPPHTQSKNEAKELCRQLAGHGSISRSFAQSLRPSTTA